MKVFLSIIKTVTTPIRAYYILYKYITFKYVFNSRSVEVSFSDLPDEFKLLVKNEDGILLNPTISNGLNKYFIPTIKYKYSLTIYLEGQRFPLLKCMLFVNKKISVIFVYCFPIIVILLVGLFLYKTGNFNFDFIGKFQKLTK